MFTAKLLKRLKKKDSLREIETEIRNKIMEDIKTSENFKLINEKSAAKILGISYSNLKHMRQQKRISCVRIGRSVRYKLTQLLRFIENGVIEAENSTN
jgi:excisionase family DNA binding protein